MASNINIGIKLMIEHAAEALERAISNADRTKLSALSGVFGSIINVLLYVVPPEALAFALNLLGELVGNALAKRNAVAGMAVEEVSERIGFGLRNLALKARAGEKVTHADIQQAMVTTTTTAHSEFPKLQPQPDPNLKPLSIWQSWEDHEVQGLLGLLEALEQEMQSDDTAARRSGDNHDRGVKGLAFRGHHAIREMLKDNPELVRQRLPKAVAGQDMYINMLHFPYGYGRDLIRIAMLEHNTGTKGLWLSMRDWLDRSFDRKNVRIFLAIFGGTGVLGGIASLIIASLIGLVIISFVAIWELLLLLLFVQAASQFTYGLGVLDKLGFASVFRLLSGDHWVFPPEMHYGHIWSGLLCFAIWRFLFTPPEMWFSWIGRQIAKINPFDARSPLNIPFRMFWSWVALKTGASIAPRTWEQRGAKGLSLLESTQSVSWFRRISITFNLIFIAIAAAWIFFDSLRGLMFVGYGFMYFVMTMAAVGGLLLYFLLELTALSPQYWPFELRQKMNHNTMYWLSRVAIGFLVLAIICGGGLGATRSLWTGMNNIGPNTASVSTESSTAKPLSTEEKACAYARKYNKKLPDYCK